MNLVAAGQIATADGDLLVGAYKSCGEAASSRAGHGINNPSLPTAAQAGDKGPQGSQAPRDEACLQRICAPTWRLAHNFKAPWFTAQEVKKRLPPLTFLALPSSKLLLSMRKHSHTNVSPHIPNKAPNQCLKIRLIRWRDSGSPALLSGVCRPL